MLIRFHFVVNAARVIDPSLHPGHPEVVPRSYSDYMFRYNTAKAAKLLKIVSRSGPPAAGSTDNEVRYYKTMDETTRDTLAYYKSKGW